MISLTSRFSLLAALASLATVSLPANAVAIPAGPRSLPMPMLLAQKRIVLNKDLLEPDIALHVDLPNAKRELFHNYFDHEDHTVDIIGLDLHIRGDDSQSKSKRAHQRFFHAPSSSSHLARRHSHDNAEVERRHSHDRYRHRGYWRHGHGTVIVKGNNDNVNFGREIERDYASMERRDGEDTGVAGRVDINKSGTGERVASLALVKTNETYILDASEANATTLYLVHAPSITPSANYTLVRLEMEMFDTETSSTVRYCATFDASPPAPTPMTIELCQNATEASNEHKSQFFEYVKETNVIKPTWFSVSNSTDGSEQGAASIDEETVSDIDIRDEGDDSESVDLVFVASAPGAPVAPQAAASDDASTVSTVTVTVTATPSPSSIAAEDAESSSMTMTSADITASETSETTIPTSSAVQNLEVVVAPAASSSEATSTVASSSNADAAPTTIDAEDVAASIASPTESVASSTEPVSVTGSATATSSNSSETPLFVSQ